MTEAGSAQPTKGESVPAVDALRVRLDAGELLFGAFLNLGSAVTAEILASAGLDWVVIDLEHGAGSETDALSQIQAVAGTDASALVRVESLERSRFQRALDMGAVGVIVPRLQTVADAELALANSRYCKQRGIAFSTRARGWAGASHADLLRADEQVICALQIETLDALRSAREIAALDGVDILFVGPADLANSLGIVGGADHPDLLESAAQVSSAAAEFGKTAGVLVATAELAETYVQIGFRFVGCSSDAGLLANEAKRVAEKLRSLPLPTK